MTVTRTEYMKEGPIRSGTWEDSRGRVWTRRGEAVGKKGLARALRSDGAQVAMFWGGELWFGPADDGGAFPAEIAEVVTSFPADAATFAEFRDGANRLVVIEISC